MDDRKIMEELGERLCDLCPLEDWEKGSHLYPNVIVAAKGVNVKMLLNTILKKMRWKKIILMM